MWGAAAIHYPFTGADRASQIDQEPRAIRSTPVQSGNRPDSPASQSMAPRAGSKSTATTSSRERARPKRARDTKPVARVAPAAPRTAAVLRRARSSGAAQAGILKPRSTPRLADLDKLDRWATLGPNGTRSTSDLPVT